jgi:hypothetical protein
LAEFVYDVTTSLSLVAEIETKSFFSFEINQDIVAEMKQDDLKDYFHAPKDFNVPEARNATESKHQFWT